MDSTKIGREFFIKGHSFGHGDATNRHGHFVLFQLKFAGVSAGPPSSPISIQSLELILLQSAALLFLLLLLFDETFLFPYFASMAILIIIVAVVIVAVALVAVNASGAPITPFSGRRGL